MTKTLEIGSSQPSADFLFSHSIACNTYVAARLTLKSGLLIPGCLLAQQFAEICAKAILRVFWQELEKKHGKPAQKVIRGYGHEVMNLLTQEADLVPEFATVAKDLELAELLEGLADVYSSGRFGERPVSGDLGEVTRLLDRLARRLFDIHTRAIKYPSAPQLYVQDHLLESFLEENLVFDREDTTNDWMASVLPLPRATN